MDDEAIEKIAVVVHEALRAWQRVNGQSVSPAWDEATWERESTLDAVRDALNNPMPERRHGG